jgi:hypothetical protein
MSQCASIRPSPTARLRNGVVTVVREARRSDWRLLRRFPSPRTHLTGRTSRCSEASGSSARTHPRHRSPMFGVQGEHYVQAQHWSGVREGPSECREHSSREARRRGGVFEADSGPFNGLELIGFLSGDGVAAASLAGAVTAPTRTPGLRETSPATAASRRWDRRALPTWLASRRQPTLLPQ